MERVWFVCLSWVHSGFPGCLCTPYSQLVPPGLDRALHCYWVSGLRDGHELVLKARRALRSRSKSSSHSWHSPELNVAKNIGEEILQDMLPVANNQTQMLDLTLTNSENTVKAYSNLADYIIRTFLWGSVIELDIQEITLEQWSIGCYL